MVVLFQSGMKKMARLSWLVILLWLSTCSVGVAQHYKAVGVASFDNPDNWVGPYNPGGVIAEVYKNYLEKSPYLLLEGKDGQANHPQFRITGKISRFEPKLQIIGSGITDAGVPELLAEVHAEVNIVHIRTQRVLVAQNFWGVGGPGGVEFGMPGKSTKVGQPQYLDTAMGWAIDRLVRKSMPMVLASINHLPLEGKVFSIKMKKEDASEGDLRRMKDSKDESEDIERVSINIGQKNGIKLRDILDIYSVEPKVSDPDSKTDLGDRLERKGSIKVIRVGEHFADGIILAGGNFETQQLVRVVENQPVPELEAMAKEFQIAGNPPEVNKEIFAPPNPGSGNRLSTMAGFNFFSLFGASVGY